jgi:hypothetical protein
MSNRILLMSAALLVGSAVVAMLTPAPRQIWWPFLLLLIPLFAFVLRSSKR